MYVMGDGGSSDYSVMGVTSFSLEFIDSSITEFRWHLGQQPPSAFCSAGFVTMSAAVFI